MKVNRNKNAPGRFISSSDEEVSTWTEVQAEHAKHHFSQTHDVLKNIRGRKGDTDYCEIGELE